MLIRSVEKCRHPSAQLCPCCLPHRDHVVFEGLPLFFFFFYFRGLGNWLCSCKVNVVKVTAVIEDAWWPVEFQM